MARTATGWVWFNWFSVAMLVPVGLGVVVFLSISLGQQMGYHVTEYVTPPQVVEVQKDSCLCQPLCMCCGCESN